MKYKNGFTLIETAIVLVIVAIIVAGVIVGRDLIRASQLRAVATEVGRYTQAVSDFRDKYFALPGDFAGATALWGSPAAGCPSGVNVATDPTTATCNGNGDGQIAYATESPTLFPYEIFRAWQHLANAGMIDGHYTGVAGSGGVTNAIIGTNVPASQLPGAGYSLYYMYISCSALCASNWPMAGHILSFGGTYPNGLTYNPILTPAEALSIDTKMDDGLPASGKVMTAKHAWNANCVTSDNAATSQYNASYKNIACFLYFFTGF